MNNVEYLRHFHDMVATGIACGLAHPIEWVINYHRMPGGSMSAEWHQEVLVACCRALVDFYTSEFIQSPDDASQVLGWVHNFYRPDHPMRDYFDGLEDLLNQEIKAAKP